MQSYDELVELARICLKQAREAKNLSMSAELIQLAKGYQMYFAFASIRPSYDLSSRICVRMPVAIVHPRPLVQITHQDHGRQIIPPPDVTPAPRAVLTLDEARGMAENFARACRSWCSHDETVMGLLVSCLVLV